MRFLLRHLFLFQQHDRWITLTNLGQMVSTSATRRCTAAATVRF